MSNLTIFINEKSVYEYDKSAVLNEQQQEFIDRMDKDMSRGIKINGELIVDPEPRQRANFVAMNLIKALLQDDAAKIQVSCAYLASRVAGIVEVHARDHDGKVDIELLENRE